MVPTLLFVDDELRRYLVAALAMGRRELRRDGIYPPRRFDELVDALAAGMRPDTPMIDTNSNLPEPELVDQKETARRLGVSERTVNRLIAARELATVKVGWRTLVPLAEVKEYGMRRHVG